MTPDNRKKNNKKKKISKGFRGKEVKYTKVFVECRTCHRHT